jgi:hypothetical protein
MAPTIKKIKLQEPPKEGETALYSKLAIYNKK